VLRLPAGRQGLRVTGFYVWVNDSYRDKTKIFEYIILNFHGISPFSNSCVYLMEYHKTCSFAALNVRNNLSAKDKGNRQGDKGIEIRNIVIFPLSEPSGSR